MKIYVAQYNDSMSPTGIVIAVSPDLGKIKLSAQEYEASIEDEPERLSWTSFKTVRNGPWLAEGFSGEYMIGEWEVVGA